MPSVRRRARHQSQHRVLWLHGRHRAHMGLGTGPCQHILTGHSSLVGLIAITTVQLGQHVADSAVSLVAAALIFAACLLLLYGLKNKLVPIAVVILSGVGGLLLLG